jgi:Glycosyltransferase family 87
VQADSLLPRARRLPSPAELGVFYEAPLIVIGFVVWFALSGNGRAMGDFLIFRDAGTAVLHGHSPYVAPIKALVAQNDRFVYPAPMAVLFTPFALLPLAAAKLLYLGLSLAAIAGAVRLLGVRDFRCYGAALFGAGAFYSLTVGSIGPFILLGAALSWRYRDRVGIAAVAVGLTALAKLLLWPLLVWLVATKRYRAAAGAAGVAVATALLGWAAIGFDGFRHYPALVRTLSDVMVRNAYSLHGLALSLGVPAGLASSLDVVLPVLGVVAILAAARAEDGDRRAFTVAVAVALLTLPILWLHYFVLLLAPIALVRPRLSRLWFAPMGLWLSPYFESQGLTWRITVVLAVGTAILAAAMARRPSETSGHAGADGDGPMSEPGAQAALLARDDT